MMLNAISPELGENVGEISTPLVVTPVPVLEVEALVVEVVFVLFINV